MKGDCERERKRNTFTQVKTRSKNKKQQHKRRQNSTNSNSNSNGNSNSQQAKRLKQHVTDIQYAEQSRKVDKILNLYGRTTPHHQSINKCVSSFI